MDRVTSPLEAPLSIACRAARDDLVILELAGDLVVTHLDAVRASVEEILDRGGRSVIVDAAGLAYVDTPSFALLVQLAGRCRERGGALVLAGLPAAFDPVAEALRLEEAIAVDRSVDQALERLQG